MHANACNCVALSVLFSGVVLYLRSQYMNFTFKKIQNGKKNIYKLFNISQSVRQSVRQMDTRWGQPQSQRWLAQRQARPGQTGPGNWNMTDIVRQRTVI